MTKLSDFGKKILGDKRYNDLRARYLFRDLESPFPLFQETPVRLDWSTYRPFTSLQVAYIVSPTQRSGTNYLSHMLDLHPNLEFPSGPNLPDEQCLYTYSNLIKEYVHKTVSTWHKWMENGDKNIQLTEHGKGLMNAMGQGILNYFAQAIQPGNKLLFKTPDAGRLENIFHLFQACKVILLVRDGRDTLESFSRSWGGDGAFKRMCERWSDRVDTLYRFKEMAERSGRSDQILMIRYDKLNRSTRDELTSILQFLEVEAEHYPWDKLEDIPVLGSSSHKTTEGHVHWNPIEKGQGFNPNEKWLQWPEKKKRIFKKIAGDNLIRLGFAKSNDW